MSKGERLFFRRNFSENNKAQYIAVYDAIVKSGSENEAVLNKLVNKICAGRQNYIKHQLHEKLLQSNAAFDASHNQQIALLNEITIIKSLRFKNQIELARKKWQKIFDKCLRMEQPAYIEILLQEKFKLELFENHQLKLKDHQNMLTYASAHALDFSKLLQLRVVYNELMFIRKRSFILFDENAARFGELKNSLTSLGQKLAKTSEEYFFLEKTSWAIVHFLEGKFEKSFAALRAVYDKVQGSISFLNYNNEFLLDFIKFYSDISFFNKNYAAVENLLAVSYTVSMANDMYLRQRSILHFLIKNRLYSTTTQYQKVDELLAQHQTDFEQWLKTASEETCTVLNAGLAISYFIAQNYAEALYYANNLINTYTKSSRQEVVAFAYIFESVIAYELNEFQTFDSKIKNAIAFFYRYPQHKEIGHEMLSALQSAFGKPTRAERRRMFEKLLKSLRASEHKISKQVIYNYFDFPAWFEAQIAGLRYQDYRKKIAAKV